MTSTKTAECSYCGKRVTVNVRSARQVLHKHVCKDGVKRHGSLARETLKSS